MARAARGARGRSARRVPEGARAGSAAGASTSKLGERAASARCARAGTASWVNLSDYLDTGLFLDHRRVRAMIGRAGARASASSTCSPTPAGPPCTPPRGGARSTTSVDLSNTYLDWAAAQFRAQRARAARARADAGRRARLAQPRGAAPLRPDLPARRRRSRNSKRMDDDFDVQRDHVGLITCLRRCWPRRARWCSPTTRANSRWTRRRCTAPLHIEDGRAATLPEDFRRNPRIHNSWRITPCPEALLAADDPRVTLRNRIVVSPMCQYSSEDGFANDWHLVHLGSRAVGGAGAGDHRGDGGRRPRAGSRPQDLGIWNDEHVRDAGADRRLRRRAGRRRRASSSRTPAARRRPRGRGRAAGRVPPEHGRLDAGRRRAPIAVRRRLPDAARARRRPASAQVDRRRSPPPRDGRSTPASR